jgi:hypothetical protein
MLGRMTLDGLFLANTASLSSTRQPPPTTLPVAAHRLPHRKTFWPRVKVDILAKFAERIGL